MGIKRIVKNELLHNILVIKSKKKITKKKKNCLKLKIYEEEVVN
jgi:hypothetical protein